MVPNSLSERAKDYSVRLYTLARELRKPDCNVVFAGAAAALVEEIAGALGGTVPPVPSGFERIGTITYHHDTEQIDYATGDQPRVCADCGTMNCRNELHIDASPVTGERTAPPAGQAEKPQQ